VTVFEQQRHAAGPRTRLSARGYGGVGASGTGLRRVAGASSYQANVAATVILGRRSGCRGHRRPRGAALDRRGREQERQNDAGWHLGDLPVGGCTAEVLRRQPGESSARHSATPSLTRWPQGAEHRIGRVQLALYK
jgi:hypothetical protein